MPLKQGLIGLKSQDELSSIIMRLFILISVLFISSAVAGQQNYYLLVGTYTQGKSKGIYVYDFNKKNGSTKLIDSIQTSNPSFLAVSPDQKFVYAVHENANNGKGGEVAAFAFDKSNGKLSFINQQLTGGDHPCYVDVDKTGKWVATANYTSGSLSVFPVRKDGRLNPASQIIQHSGSSVNPERQKEPHVHSTVFSPDNDFLLSADLGTDKFIVYSFDEKTGQLTQKNQYNAKPGDGPRHLAFHPNGEWVYLINELSGFVDGFELRKGILLGFTSVTAVPKNYSGPSPASADIHVSPDGKFLYASHRAESNTIVIFKIDQKTGKLTNVGYQSTLGKTPRNFNFDPSGDYLLVANQNSDNIVIFKVNRQTGLLDDTGKRIDIGSPVCIKWIEK
jgi:6-phosphogluconolactonase